MKIYKKIKFNWIENRINVIKLYFMGLTILLFAVVGGGSFAIKDNAYINEKYIFSNVESLGYKLDYSRQKYGLLASVKNAISAPAIYEKGGFAKSIPVLAYHGIVKKPDTSDENVTINEFKNQMFTLKNEGYNTVSTQDLYHFLKGEKKLPEKSFIISFDDGRRDAFLEADPVLKAIDFTAVDFVITKYFGNESNGKYYLGKEEMTQMKNNGRWEIHAHAKEGHAEYSISADNEKGSFYGNKLWLADYNRIETDDEFRVRISNDLAGAKADLAEKNIFTDSFAFPFGDFGQDFSNYSKAQDVATEEGRKIYNLIFYQNAPKKRFTGNYFASKPLPDSEAFLVRRILIRNFMSPEDIIKQMEKGSPKPLPYYDDFTSNNGWINSWGKQNIESHVMTLSAKEGEKGSATVLDGSNEWRDYSIKAKANIPKENGIYLWIRFKDDDNNAACNLSGNSASIEQTVGGQKITLNKSKSSNLLPKDFFSVEARVKGNTIGCYVGGKLVVSSTGLDQSLDMGGIGFKAWDSAPKNSGLIIKELSVDPI